ncbi:VC0807 family protein [Nocardia nova]|uniref:VC0807 family protein n=1 Tax=Nocardia nova TaxID=37330 RepID=UPI0033EE26BA
MTESTSASFALKARVLAAGLADMLIDLIVPTVVFAALAPLGLSTSIRLTVGGFFVAAKAVAGRVEDHDSKATIARFLPAAATAIVCASVTIAAAETGHSDAVSIAVGSILLTIAVTVTLLVRPRRLDAFAVLVLVESVAAVVLTSISTDPRFILARPSIYTAIAGVYVLGTATAARPFMMQVSKAAAAGGDPVRAQAFERAGRESLRFRRAEQAMTIGLGVVLLVEAVLRVVTVYSRPEAAVVSTSLLSQLPGLALLIAYFAVVRIFAIPVVSREVDALMPLATDARSEKEPSA